MIFLELLYGTLLLLLASLASWKDCTSGIIPNKLLAFFAVIGLSLDAIYYGFFLQDLKVSFFLNLLLICAVSLFLFYTHSLAGGDTKFLFVISLLYPANFLITYGKSNVTLIFALGFGILLGYCYLLVNSIFKLVKRENRISWSFVQKSTAQFLFSFFCASVYTTAVSMLLFLIFPNTISKYPWISYSLCILTASCTGRFQILRRWYLIVTIFAVDCLLGCILHIFPFAIHPENYLMILALLFCRMMISTNIYTGISVSALKPGMILSTFSSSLMQGTRLKGLPAVSAENLKNRLTQSEIDSIIRWAASRNIESVTIVKKIPFALFISAGYLIYFLFWSLIR